MEHAGDAAVTALTVDSQMHGNLILTVTYTTILTIYAPSLCFSFIHVYRNEFEFYVLFRVNLIPQTQFTPTG